MTVFRAISPSEEVDREAESEALARAAEQVIGPDPPVEARVTVSSSVVDAIVEETRRGVYLRGSALRLLAFSSIL